MPLVWRGARTLTITSTRSGGRQHYHLGSIVILTVRGPAGEMFFNGIDLALRTTPLTVPGIQGEWSPQATFNLIHAGVVNSQGEGSLNLPVSNVSALGGTPVFFQSATAGPGGVFFTNVADCIVSK